MHQIRQNYELKSKIVKSKSDKFVLKNLTRVKLIFLFTRVTILLFYISNFNRMQ